MNAIGLLIAFVIIFVVIYVNIVNKKRQIGVQKAIGIEQNVIIASFVLQAMLYAGAGVIFGYAPDALRDRSLYCIPSGAGPGWSHKP